MELGREGVNLPCGVGLPLALPASEGKALKIAVAGKGGSGKTVIAALMIRIATEMATTRVLAIDADSAVSLPYALGIDFKDTVSEIRSRLIEDPHARAAARDKPIRDLMAAATQPGQGVVLLVMGRPEGPGCYCGINDMLRYGIDSLTSEYGVIVIDCEAGPEQMNRRVVNGVDVLAILTDVSLRGVRVARSIMKVVENDPTMVQTQIGLVINRSRDNHRTVVDEAAEWELDVLGIVPEDQLVAEYDGVGRPIIELPSTSPSVHGVRAIMNNIRSAHPQSFAPTILSR